MKRALLTLMLLVFTSLSAPVDNIPFLKMSFLNLKEDLEEAKSEGKYLFLMFHQEACPFCDKMYRITFQDKEVKEFFTKHFYMVLIDIKGANTLITLDGKEMTEKEFSHKKRVRATPLFIFLDQEGKEILKMVGYIPPKDFLLIGKYIVGGHYKKESFYKFLRRERNKN
jgi:thioredoxin-related protein